MNFSYFGKYSKKKENFFKTQCDAFRKSSAKETRPRIYLAENF